MHELCKLAEFRVSNALPEKLFVIFEGWRACPTYYVSVLATYIVRLTNKKSYNENGKLLTSKNVQSALLCCWQTENGVLQSTEEHHNFLLSVISVLLKNVLNVVAVFADRFNTNRAILRRIGPTFLRFHSDLFYCTFKTLTTNSDMRWPWFKHWWNDWPFINLLLNFGESLHFMQFSAIRLVGAQRTPC